MTTAKKNDQYQEADEEEGDSGLLSREGWGGWDGPFEDAEQRSGGGETADGHANRALDAGGLLLRGGTVRIPTFAEVVDALKVKPWRAPTAFRPAAALCGHLNSPFDSVIPFERLQVCGLPSCAAVGAGSGFVMRVGRRAARRDFSAP